MNTHRVIIETSVPPSMELIAAGPLEFCQTQLTEWIAKHPLPEFGTGIIAEVTNPEHEAFIAKASADPEGVQLAKSAANLATTWGKEWGVRWAGNNNDKQVTIQASKETAQELIDAQFIPHMWEIVSRVIGPWKEERP